MPGYCPAWPDYLKEAWLKWDKQAHYVTCLESYIKRIDPNEFDDVYERLAEERQELLYAATNFTLLFRSYHNWSIANV